MTSENSDPPDKPAVTGNETKPANRGESQNQSATDNDVIIVKVITGAILTIVYWFKDEIGEGIKDLCRRVRKIGPAEFDSSSKIETTQHDNKAQPKKR